MLHRSLRVAHRIKKMSEQGLQFSASWRDRTTRRSSAASYPKLRCSLAAVRTATGSKGTLSLLLFKTLDEFVGLRDGAVHILDELIDLRIHLDQFTLQG